MSIQTAIDALAAKFGEYVTTAQAIRDQHGQNEAYFPVTPPDAVVFPGSTADVSAIARLCTEHGCPIVAYGAGTSLEGAQLAFQGGIALDMSRMTDVLAVNQEDMDAVVQPGITREALNTELRATGLMFPVDPGANATIGGMASTRASGTTAVRYGTMRENILALEAVMADGTIVRTGTQARKSSTGYDLTHLLVGSEGTLGIITELTVKLQGIPEAISAATCRFPTIEDAVNCVILTIQTGIPMARIELVDEMMVRGFNNYADAGLPEVPHLFLEFHGSETGVAEQAEMFGAIAEDFGVEAYQTATKTEDRNALWAMRHKSHYASASLGKTGHLMPTDVCVPISQLPACVSAIQEVIATTSIQAPLVGHVGDGNFHLVLLYDPESETEVREARHINSSLVEMAIEMGGTCTGEHGVGVEKRDLMPEMFTEEDLNQQMRVKCAFDPDHLLNPGKMFPQLHRCAELGRMHVHKGQTAFPDLPRF